MVLLTSVHKIFIIIRFVAYLSLGLVFIEYCLYFHHEILIYCS